MKIEIKHTDLVGAVKPRKGFSGLNTGRVGCTAPWSRLEKVGGKVFEIKGYCRPYTDNISLLIRQGGIKDDNLPRHYKTIFREDVFPSIKNFAPYCGNVFTLTLHFNFDLLFLAELEYD